MKRVAVVWAAVVWAAVVASVWLVATALLAWFAQRGFGGPLGATLAHSAARSLVVCVCVAGPASAVALALRGRFGASIAVAGGLGVAFLAFLVAFVLFGPVSAALTAVAPVVLVVAVQLALAFAVRARMLRHRTADSA